MTFGLTKPHYFAARSWLAIDLEFFNPWTSNIQRHECNCMLHMSTYILSCLTQYMICSKTVALLDETRERIIIPLTLGSK